MLSDWLAEALRHGSGGHEPWRRSRGVIGGPSRVPDGGGQRELVAGAGEAPGSEPDHREIMLGLARGRSGAAGACHYCGDLGPLLTRNAGNARGRCREFSHIPTAQQQRPFPFEFRWWANFGPQWQLYQPFPETMPGLIQQLVQKEGLVAAATILMRRPRSWERVD